MDRSPWRSLSLHLGDDDLYVLALRKGKIAENELSTSNDDVVYAVHARIIRGGNLRAKSRSQWASDSGNTPAPAGLP